MGRKTKRPSGAPKVRRRWKIKPQTHVKGSAKVYRRHVVKDRMKKELHSETE